MTTSALKMCVSCPIKFPNCENTRNPNHTKKLKNKNFAQMKMYFFSHNIGTTSSDAKLNRYAGVVPCMDGKIKKEVTGANTNNNDEYALKIFLSSIKFKL